MPTTWPIARTGRLGGHPGHARFASRVEKRGRPASSTAGDSGAEHRRGQPPEKARGPGPRSAPGPRARRSGRRAPGPPTRPGKGCNGMRGANAPGSPVRVARARAIIRGRCKPRRLVLAGVLCLAGLAAAASGPLGAAAPADEPPPTFSAAQLLTPAQIKGPHHTVASAVQTEGYFHEFRIQSEFGAFDAAGRSMLAVRLREIEALAQLEDVSKTEVFLKAAGQVRPQRRQGRGQRGHQSRGDGEGYRFRRQAVRRQPRPPEQAGGRLGDRRRSSRSVKAGRQRSRLRDQVPARREQGVPPVGAEARRRSLHDQPGASQGARRHRRGGRRRLDRHEGRAADSRAWSA